MAELNESSLNDTVVQPLPAVTPVLSGGVDDQFVPSEYTKS